MLYFTCNDETGGARKMTTSPDGRTEFGPQGASAGQPYKIWAGASPVPYGAGQAPALHTRKHFDAGAKTRNTRSSRSSRRSEQRSHP
jgi:hypothetical protein